MSFELEIIGIWTKHVKNTKAAQTACALSTTPYFVDNLKVEREGKYWRKTKRKYGLLFFDNLSIDSNMEIQLMKNIWK